MCAWLPALPLKVSSACGVHPLLHIVCVHRSHSVPPYLLSPRSRVCTVCGFTLYACPTHMCCTLPMAIPTHNQRPPLVATGPYGPCVTMPAWACSGGLRSSTRCTSSSSSTHIHDNLPMHTPAHMVPPCAHLLFPAPQLMSTLRCAYHGKAPVRAGMAM